MTAALNLPMEMDDRFAADIIKRTIAVLQTFYHEHSFIPPSHGLAHALAVYAHAVQAVACVHDPRCGPRDQCQIVLAALLHDVDDGKYFSPAHVKDCTNAKAILQQVGATTTMDEEEDFILGIVQMIKWVGCSKNGNSVPDIVKQTKKYYWLIPRWSDRLEAVGTMGVRRCYQYALEQNDPLWSHASPRATTLAQVWNMATPERFEQYQQQQQQQRSGRGSDMISHYYDKLLHIARPPPEIVQNAYLERQAESGAEPLVQVCLEFGRTGQVKVEFLEELCAQEQSVG